MPCENPIVPMPKKDRIKIGAYAPFAKCDEEYIAALAESGIDLALYGLNQVPAECHTELFRLLHKYGIEASMRKGEWMKSYKGAPMLDIENHGDLFFKDEPVFKYFTYVDEPGAIHFEELGKEVEKFKQTYPGKEPYINLLPMYANTRQLTSGAGADPIDYYQYDSAVEAFTKYLRDYCKYVNTSYICADIYPCHRYPDPNDKEAFPDKFIKKTYKDYVRSIEPLASVCRETGREMWTVIQTSSWNNGSRPIEESELRWQAYTMLSFGSKALIYYVYSGATGQKGCCMDKDGNKSPLFYASKRLCDGVKKLSDLYYTYDNLGAFNVNSTPETTPYLEMENPYTDFKVIKDITATTPLLVGCFKKKNGDGHAFTLVNMQDHADPAESKIKVKITGKVTMYYDGEPTELTATDGYYEFTLAQGDGVFVTVEPYKVEKLKDDRIRIGAYTPIDKCDEEHIAMLAEAGVDFAVINLENYPEETKDKLFGWLAQNGIEATVRDSRVLKYYNKAGMLDFDKTDLMYYRDEPSFAAFTYVDEPGIEHFEQLGKEVEQFKKEFPGKRPYINLLPMYANAAQLTGGAWKSAIEYYETPSTDFQQYLDEYVAKIDTDYICTDIYPHRRVKDPKCPDMFPAEYLKLTYPHYVRSIEITADVARASGRDLWVCIQTCSWARAVREPDEYELRWQAYTMLSYGAKALLYYVFAFRKNHSGTCLDMRGDKTKLFFASKRLCEGLKRLSDLYVSYKNLGAFAVNYDPETTPYLEMANPYTGPTAFSSIESNNPLLVGCFEKKEGSGRAYTIVNMQDFCNPGTAYVKLKAEGRITVYRDGKPAESAPSGQMLTIGLLQGDGVFVTVD